MLLHNVQLSFMSSWTVTSLIEKHIGPLLYQKKSLSKLVGLIIRVGIAHCLVQQKEIQHGRLAVTVETLLILNILSVGRGSLDRIQ